MAATKATREVSVATPESSRSWKTVLREQGNRLTPQREVCRRSSNWGTQPLTTTNGPFRTRLTPRTSPQFIEPWPSWRISASSSTSILPTAPRSTTPRRSPRMSIWPAAAADVTDAQPDDFAALALSLVRSYGFDADLDRLVVNGTCRDCREA